MRDKNGNRIPSPKVQNRNAVRQFMMQKAAELPVTYEDHRSSMRMTGMQILDNPDILKNLTADQIEKLDAGKTYDVPATLTRRVNHFQRMMNLVKAKGADAAVQYYNEVREIGLLSLKQNEIGNIKTEVDFGSPIRNY